MAAISPELRVIFSDALELTSQEERLAYLDRACQGDPDLRARIDALLLAHDGLGEFLEQPVPTPSVTCDAPSPLESPGTVIGPDKLLQQIGEGGMGTVYMAEQQEPVRRRVALKIIKPGMDSRQVIARFEAERQALAIMDHQNIARVLDAGTTESGRPYFVMELVHGVPITQFCDENHLTPRQRLELFVPVCQAIQHAHQKGIIHRDVKPSNVLVTMYDDKPVPKVIDFGVAKAIDQRLTEKTMFTQFGAFVGTFEYMSPEQAQMNAFGVDTRSDIYSLGVLLYELLTGTTPLGHERLRRAAVDEMVRLIKEEEAMRPSARLSSSNNLPKIAAARNTDPARLSGIVRGELDWIVMKCLEKDRTRRYESSNGLARDIQRYLADEPVEACPPGAGYRLRKFAHKYRTPLRVAGMFLVLLIGAAIVSTWQAIRATLAENRVTQQRDLARAKEAEAIRAREETGKANQKLQKTTGDLRAALYVSDLNRAYQYWDSGNIQRVEELLERHRPIGREDDLRGVEWHYLRRLATRFQAGRIADVHKTVWDLALSPDGKSLAAMSGNGAITIWDSATGDRRFHIADASAGYLAYTADGTLISAPLFPTIEKGPRSAIIRLRGWDVATGKEVIARRVNVDAGDFGHGGRLADDGTAIWGFTSDGKLRMWDTATGHEIVTLDPQAADPSIERAPGHFAGLANGRKALVWRMGGMMMVWDIPTKAIRLKHSHPLHWSAAVAFSADGKLVAWHRGGPPHVVQLWDWNAGKQVAEMQGFAGHVYALRFSPDGKALAAADELGTIRLMDVATSKEIAALKGHGVQVPALAFAPDGSWLYSASVDGLIRRWKLIPDQDPDQFEGDPDFYPVAGGISADGRSYFTYSRFKLAYQFELVHRDLTNHRELARFQVAGNTIVSGNGKCVVFQKSGQRTIRLRDIFANREFTLLESPSWATGRKGFSPDGRVLAWCDPDQIRLWDSETGKPVGSLPQANASAIAFSADGRYFAAVATRTGAAAPSVTVWKTPTLAETGKLPGEASALTFSPNGETLAVIRSDRVMLWEVHSQVVRAVINASYPGPELSSFGFRRYGFAPDGKLFAIDDNTNMRTGIWKAATGELVGYLAGPRESIWGLSWSPDGKTLVTNTGGPKVKLWNVATLEELTTLTLTNRVGCQAFAPDGSLVLADQMNRIRIWRTGLDQDAR
jgi:eukaryotic-like serine/threonine-protein kinase